MKQDFPNGAMCAGDPSPSTRRFGAHEWADYKNPSPCLVEVVVKTIVAAMRSVVAVKVCTILKAGAVVAIVCAFGRIFACEVFSF